jgi:hypothetical protein
VEVTCGYMEKLKIQFQFTFTVEFLQPASTLYSISPSRANLISVKHSNIKQNIVKHSHKTTIIILLNKDNNERGKRQ